MLLSWLQLWAFNLEPRRLQHQKVSEPCPLPGLEARIQKLEHHEERRHFRPALGFEGEMAESEPRGAGGEGFALSARGSLQAGRAPRCPGSRRACPRTGTSALLQQKQQQKKKAERKAKSVSQLPGAAAAQGLSLSPLLLLAREVSPSPAAGGMELGK